MFAACQSDLNNSSLIGGDGGDFFAQAKYGFLSPHMVTERFDNFLIYKVKKGRSLVDYSYLDSERSEHRSVFKPDYTGPNNYCIVRNSVAQPDIIGIQDRFAKWNLRRSCCASAACNQNIVGLYNLGSLFVFDLESMLAGKPCRAIDDYDPVTPELFFDHRGFSRYYGVHALHQIRDTYLLFEFVIPAIKSTLTIAGQIEHRFAERLARNSSGVQRYSAEHFPAVDNRATFAELCRGYRTFLTSRAAANNYQLKTIRLRIH